jgi:hypothetical protein
LDSRTDGYHLYGKGQKLPLRKNSLAGQAPPPPSEDNHLYWWGSMQSRSNYLMGNRLLPSSEDSNNNFSRTPPRTRTEIMMNQTTGLRLPALSAVHISNPSFYSLFFKTWRVP